MQRSLTLARRAKWRRVRSGRRAAPTRPQAPLVRGKTLPEHAHALRAPVGSLGGAAGGSMRAA